MFKINARDCVIKDVNKKVERDFSLKIIYFASFKLAIL